MTHYQTPATLKGTLGRVYGGVEDLVHLTDGTRGSFGQRVADFIDTEMRVGDPDAGDNPLCPGCFMVAIVATAMTLAERNGQSMAELGRSMAHAFTQVAHLADGALALPEEILIAPFIEGKATEIAG